MGSRLARLNRRRGIRRLFLVAGATLLIVAFGTAILVLLGRGIADAFKLAGTVGVLAILANLVGNAFRTRSEAGERARGAVFAAVRSREGTHQRLADRWYNAEVRPAVGRLDVMPTSGPSAVPFHLEVLAATDTGHPARGRPLLVPGFRVVEVATPSGVIDLAMSPKNIPWLLERIDGRHGQDG